MVFLAAVAASASAQSAAPGTLAPLDWSLRTRIYVHKFVSFQSVFDTAPGVAFNHGIDSPESWNQRAGGLGRRVASSYGQYAARETIELAMFAVHKEDPRYVRRRSGPFKSRAGQVLKSSVVARGLDGRDTFALGSVVGIFGARAVALAWLPPEKQTASSVLISGGLGLLTKAAGTAVREFWPDVRRKFRR